MCLYLCASCTLGDNASQCCRAQLTKLCFTYVVYLTVCAIHYCGLLKYLSVRHISLRFTTNNTYTLMMFGAMMLVMCGEAVCMFSLFTHWRSIKWTKTILKSDLSLMINNSIYTLFMHFNYSVEGKRSYGRVAWNWVNGGPQERATERPQNYIFSLLTQQFHAQIGLILVSFEAWKCANSKPGIFIFFQAERWKPHFGFCYSIELRKRRVNYAWFQLTTQNLYFSFMILCFFYRRVALNVSALADVIQPMW